MTSCPFVSIVIPTYNREKMLSITIDSFINQLYPKNRYEIIVVNNNSKDNTQSVINSYIEKYPNLIKTCFESRQGVHYARNTAAHATKGELLYYTDDDMIADENLIKNLVQVFIDNSDVASASGKVIPEWEIEPPVWVKENLNNGWLSLNDLGDQTIISKDDIGVFSCHQMLRREVFFKSGGFNPENTAGEWIGDGETGLNIKIKELGFKFAYVGTSVIKHMIPPSRMTQEYLDKRLANQGNCDSYTDYKKYMYNNLKLLILAFEFLFMSLKKRLYYFTRLYKLNKKMKVRYAKAYSCYYFNRAKYNFKIIFSKRWRRLILRYDWLNDITNNKQR